MKQKFMIYVTAFGALISSTLTSMTVPSIVLLYNLGFINGDIAKAALVKSIERTRRKVFKCCKIFDCPGYRGYSASMKETYKKLGDALNFVDNAF